MNDIDKLKDAYHNFLLNYDLSNAKVVIESGKAFDLLDAIHALILKETESETNSCTLPL